MDKTTIAKTLITKPFYNGGMARNLRQNTPSSVKPRGHFQMVEAFPASLILYLSGLEVGLLRQDKTNDAIAAT
jgi:hypothetical protein